MFTKIRLKNFKSFGDITFDISSNKTAKNLVVLYGKNGAGKSNVMSSFVFLKELMSTMDVRDRYEALLAHEDEYSKISDEKLSSMLRQRLLEGLRSIKIIIDDYKMIGSTDNMYVEYNFIIDGRQGKYAVELDESGIVEEELEFVLKKRRGTYFKCSKDGFVLNNTIITDNDLISSIKENVRKYWGKHSVLAILLHEREDKSESFAENNYSDNLNFILNKFLLMSGSLFVGKRQWIGLSTRFPFIYKPIKGRVEKEHEQDLDRFARAFAKVFYYTDQKISNLYYKKTYLNNNKIGYELFETRRIAGKNIDVPFIRESTGNIQLLEFFCRFINTTDGQVVVLDEADTGIHEVQFQNLLKELQPYITGQLIMTAHNTLLMELENARSFVYIIDDDGEQVKIRSISDYDKRTFKNNNIRNRYLSNQYGGLPENQGVNFGLLFKELE